ncbi:hypothetical protein BH09VER1_BH09VER1_46060 [soil metagenome]
MNLRILRAGLIAIALATNLMAIDTTTNWEGFQRQDFVVAGRPALLISPRTPAPGQPWIWRTEFFGHEPQADIALLQKGFHVAYIDLQNMYGAPPALAIMDEFYQHLQTSFQLAPKVVLEGFSRGGLFALNWAALHPGKVSSIYLDAPVCDFKSWPAGFGHGEGSPNDWLLCKQAYGLADDAAARSYSKNPIDQLEPLASSGVPILIVFGGADTTVPPEENARAVEKKYQALGGRIVLLEKPGVGHHPHSLPDPKPIVDFILAHWSP